MLRQLRNHSEVNRMSNSEHHKESDQHPIPTSVQDSNQGQNKNSSQSKPIPYNQRQHRNRVRIISADIMLEKARKLAQSGRVEFLDNGVYNVIGDHGTYIVALDHTSKLSCNCPGFMQKGKCSHTTAVMLVTKNRHRRH